LACIPLNVRCVTEVEDGRAQHHFPQTLAHYFTYRDKRTEKRDRKSTRDQGGRKSKREEWEFTKAEKKRKKHP